MKVKAISSGNMSANIESNPIDISKCDTWSAQFIYTGSPVGDLVVRASSVRDGTYDDLDGGTKPLSGAGGSFSLNHIGHAGYKWIKCYYTRTSGSGSMDVYVTGKERR